jgi:hypothetical protein
VGFSVYHWPSVITRPSYRYPRVVYGYDPHPSDADLGSLYAKRHDAMQQPLLSRVASDQLNDGAFAKRAHRLGGGEMSTRWLGWSKAVLAISGRVLVAYTSRLVAADYASTQVPKHKSRWAQLGLFAAAVVSSPVVTTSAGS